MTTLLLVAILATQPKPIITIDDGPHHRYHVKTLQLLQLHNVKAIWFVNGHFLRDKQNQVLLRRINQAGHTIANHLYSHRPPCKLTARQFRIELVRTELAVNRTLGWPKRHRMKLYRPPFGQKCHNRLARNLGYRTMLWHRADIGSKATRMIRTVQALQHRTVPRKAILLFHYHNNKLRTVLQTFFPIVP